MLFIWHGSVLPKILPQLIILTSFSLLVLLVQGKIYAYKVNLNPTIFTLIGIALAIFVGFCNTASYDRYWEGRKLWGTMVVEIRSLVRQIDTLVDAKGDEKLLHEKNAFIKTTVALAWALNFQLRRHKDNPHLARLLGEQDAGNLSSKEFIPVVILARLGKYISGWMRTGHIDTIVATSLNQQLNNLSTTIGSCERILNTPLPFTYHVLLHRTVYVYCFLLPFGLVDVIGWMMPILVVFISYTFISLDAIVSEIGEPFGEEANDLALNSICRNIEFSVFEQTNIAQPPLEKPDTYFID